MLSPTLSAMPIRRRSLDLRVQLSTYVDNEALPAFARHTPLLRQSIDISCPPSRHQQTCSSGFAAVGPCWDRQTDRQTDTVPFHRPYSAYYAGSANNGKPPFSKCSRCRRITRVVKPIRSFCNDEFLCSTVQCYS